MPDPVVVSSLPMIKKKYENNLRESGKKKIKSCIVWLTDGRTDGRRTTEIPLATTAFHWQEISNILTIMAT